MYFSARAWGSTFRTSTEGRIIVSKNKFVHKEYRCKSESYPSFLSENHSVTHEIVAEGGIEFRKVYDKIKSYLKAYTTSIESNLSEEAGFFLSRWKKVVVDGQDIEFLYQEDKSEPFEMVKVGELTGLIKLDSDLTNISFEVSINVLRKEEDDKKLSFCNISTGYCSPKLRQGITKLLKKMNKELKAMKTQENICKKKCYQAIEKAGYLKYLTMKKI